MAPQTAKRRVRATLFPIVALAATLGSCDGADVNVNALTDGGYDVGGGSLTAMNDGNTMQDTPAKDAGSDSRLIDAAVAQDAPQKLDAAAVEVAPPADAQPVSMQAAEKICAQVAQVTCERFKACAAALFTERYPSLAFCEAAAARECVGRVKLPGINWDAARANRCAERTATLTCTDWFAKGLDSACEPGAGLLPDGASCDRSKDAQCQGFCSMKGVDACGKCAPILKLGADCTGAATSCDKDLTCLEGDNGIFRCEALQDVGMSCGLLRRCKRLSFCPAGPNSCVSSIACVKQCEIAVGKEGDDCTRHACDPRLRLICDPDTRRCAPNLRCQGVAGSNKCYGDGELGAACGAGKPACALPSECLGGMCTFAPRPSACP